MSFKILKYAFLILTVFNTIWLDFVSFIYLFAKNPLT